MATFKPGVSGNRAGRPKGALNKRTQLSKFMESHAEELISKTVELALSGDTVALRLCIERLMPKITDKPATVTMPDLSLCDTTKIIPQLLQSLSGQELSILDIKNLMELFNNHDAEVHNKNIKHTKLELHTRDPIEAAKAYARIMQNKHLGQE